MNGEDARSIASVGGFTPASSDAPERFVDVLYVSPEAFRRSPQRGVQRRITWSALIATLSRPRTGETKDAWGAWSPGEYLGCIRKKARLISIGALVVDVDAGGDVDRVARAIERYPAVVHETFSSTPADPRCRIVVHLAEPIDARSYEHLHAVVRTHLRLQCIEADAAAKDASRLSYLPVRRAGAGYRVVVTDGPSLSAARVLAAQPRSHAQRVHAAPGPRGGAYGGIALASAGRAVASAREGARNDTLFRETFSVARLEDLDTVTIEATMLEAGMAAGLPELEARRTIRSALRSRRGAL